MARAESVRFSAENLVTALALDQALWGRKDANPESTDAATIRTQSAIIGPFAATDARKAVEWRRLSNAGNQKSARLTLAMKATMAGRLLAEAQPRVAQLTSIRAAMKIKYGLENSRKKTTQKVATITVTSAKSQIFLMVGKRVKKPPTKRRIAAPKPIIGSQNTDPPGENVNIVRLPQ